MSAAITADPLLCSKGRGMRLNGVRTSLQTSSFASACACNDILNKLLTPQLGRTVKSSLGLVAMQKIHSRCTCCLPLIQAAVHSMCHRSQPFVCKPRGPTCSTSHIQRAAVIVHASAATLWHCDLKARTVEIGAVLPSLVPAMARFLSCPATRRAIAASYYPAHSAMAQVLQRLHFAAGSQEPASR